MLSELGRSTLGDLELSMICPSCEFDNIQGADACESCGTDLTEYDIPDSAAELLPADSVQPDLSACITRTPISAVEGRTMILVEPTTPISSIVKRMSEANVGCALVVYEGEALIGIVSERDILVKVAHQYDDVRDNPVSEIMTPAPETLPPDATIAWALNRMDLGGCRHIPIEENERPTGLVSVRDLLKFLIDRYSNVGSA